MLDEVQMQPLLIALGATLGFATGIPAAHQGNAVAANISPSESSAIASSERLFFHLDP
jgi:hypothetical protein